MNYDTIIIELLSRVQALEEQVKRLEKSHEDNSKGMRGNNMDGLKKVTTADIKKYIEDLKQKAREQNEISIVLVARNISNELGLKQRYPMVCNAMRQCMNSNDEIVFSPESGYSSTLEIKYYL